jgi:hypothetical protein
MRRLRWVELVDPTAAAAGKRNRHAIYPRRTDNCCSRVALTLGHSSTNTEKITLSDTCPVQAIRARRRMPSSMAPSFVMAARERTFNASTPNCTRLAPHEGIAQQEVLGGRVHHAPAKLGSIVCAVNIDGAMRCFGPNVASESNALPRSDDRERNPGACAAVVLNARPEGFEALSSHRIGVKRRPDFTIGICSLPQRLPVKLLAKAAAAPIRFRGPVPSTSCLQSRMLDESADATQRSMRSQVTAGRQ